MRGRGLLYVLFILVLIGGIMAWWAALPDGNYKGSGWWRLIDSFYFALQHFGGGFSEFALDVRNGTTGAPTDEALWWLSVVRLLALLLGIFVALLALVAGFRARVFAWGRWFWYGHHDLVIGYGRVGRGMAVALQKSGSGRVGRGMAIALQKFGSGRVGRCIAIALQNLGGGRVVAITRAPSTFAQSEARRQGIELYVGDARDLARRDDLPAARLRHARRIFISAGSDAETLAIAGEILAFHPQLARRVWMNFEDRMLLERSRDLPNPGGDAQRRRPQTVSMAEATAEFLVTPYRPMLAARACGQARLHAVIIGFDQSTWSVIEQLVLNGTFPPPSYARPRITVIDADGDRARARWCARHAALARWADIDFVAADPASIAWTCDDPVLRGVEDCDPPSLYVFARVAASLPQALGLHHAMAKGERWPARIFVIADTRRLAVDAMHRDPVLRFGDTAADLQDDVVLIGDPAEVGAIGTPCNRPITSLATAIHHRYAPDMPFDQLAETLRVSNRRAAIHAIDKLALLGFEDCAANAPGFGLSVAAADRLGQMLASDDGAALEAVAGFEHVRWCVDRVVDGWRPGPRDDAARRREQLDFGGARYGELAQDERQKDRDQIETLIDWIKSGGRTATDYQRIVERRGPDARWVVGAGVLALELSAEPTAALLAAATGEVCRLLIAIPAEPPLAPGEVANARASARRAAYAGFARALRAAYPKVRFRLLRARAEGRDWLAQVDPVQMIDGATLPPFTIGFAGPRDFTPTAEIAAALTAAIEARAANGRPLRLVTGIAKGADALMIALCRDRMRVLGIASDAAAEEAPQRTLCHHIDMGVLESGAVDMHAAIGLRIISSCDLLIAIDSGVPGGGPGGTADTIVRARALGRPVIIVPMRPVP